MNATNPRDPKPRHPARAIARRVALGGSLAVLLAACEPPGAPSPPLGAAGGGAGAQRAATGHAAPLSDATFEAMPLDEQYRVTSKLLGTLYTGVPVAEFYALDAGRALTRRHDAAPTLASIRAALATELSPEARVRLDTEIVGDEDALDESGLPAPIEAAYRFDGNRPKQMPLARMARYPTSRDRYSQWMAWHLANTILFSPAEEIDSRRHDRRAEPLPPARPGDPRRASEHPRHGGGAPEKRRELAPLPLAGGQHARDDGDLPRAASTATTRCRWPRRPARTCT